MEKLKHCIEFVLLTLLLWLIGLITIFVGGCILALGPIIALWTLIEANNDDNEDDEY